MNKKIYTGILFLFAVLTGIRAQIGEHFRFALLTDIHVTQKGTAFDDLQNSIHQVNRTQDIDFVLVTGDITEEGDRASMQRVKAALGQLKVKYYIIPGNHETKWSESGVTDFGHIFGGERFKFEHKGFLFLGFNSGPLMRMADGHVVPQDITWLKKELKEAGKEKPVFLVTIRC
jgi:3',5'-cyclic AMP phosphodiesterase CpdA